MLLGSPLLIACLLLSYRRSFWIASVLGVLLVLLLGTSPAGRRLLVPASLAVAARSGCWARFTSNPTCRSSSGSPRCRFSKLEANSEDRYRLDERANVLSEIAQHPITGLGVGMPWQATAAPLSVEHEEGRQYVHFAALWFWLKLGVLGLCAYVGMIVGSLVLAWQAWRRSRSSRGCARSPSRRCAASPGLVVMDTTASFTGVEARFTLVLAVQIGLLGAARPRARLARRPTRACDGGSSSERLRNRRARQPAERRRDALLEDLRARLRASRSCTSG